MPRVVRPCRACPDSDEAVSDVVGAILLVGITVGMTVVLAVLLTVYDGPEAVPQADLAVSVVPGADGSWDTGDEQVRIRHLGGQPLKQTTVVSVDIDGATTRLTGPALASRWSDGRLTIGETWSWTPAAPASIAADDLVSVQVTGLGGGNSALLAALTVVPGGAP